MFTGTVILTTWTKSPAPFDKVQTEGNRTVLETDKGISPMLRDPRLPSLSIVKTMALTCFSFPEGTKGKSYPT